MMIYVILESLRVEFYTYHKFYFEFYFDFLVFKTLSTKFGYYLEQLKQKWDINEW